MLKDLLRKRKTVGGRAPHPPGSAVPYGGGGGSLRIVPLPPKGRLPAGTGSLGAILRTSMSHGDFLPRFGRNSAFYVRFWLPAALVALFSKAAAAPVKGA